MIWSCHNDHVDVSSIHDPTEVRIAVRSSISSFLYQSDAFCQVLLVHVCNGETLNFISFKEGSQVVLPHVSTSDQSHVDLVVGTRTARPERFLYSSRPYR